MSMTLSISEHRALMGALNVAIGRYESAARFYKARPDRYGDKPVQTAETKAATIKALQSRLYMLRARRDVMEVA